MPQVAVSTPQGAGGLTTIAVGGGRREVLLEDLERALGAPTARIWQVLLTLRDCSRTGLIHPTNAGVAMRAHVTPKQLRTGMKRLRQAGLVQNLLASWARVPRRGTTVVQKVFWRRVHGAVNLRGAGYVAVPPDTLAWAAARPTWGGRRAGAGRPRKAVAPTPAGPAIPASLVGHLTAAEAQSYTGAGAVTPKPKSSGQARMGNQEGTPIGTLQRSREVPEMKPSGFPSGNQKSALLTQRTEGSNLSAGGGDGAAAAEGGAFPHLAATTRWRRPRLPVPLPAGVPAPTAAERQAVLTALGGGLKPAPVGALAPRSPTGRVLAGLVLVRRPGGRAYYAPAGRDDGTLPRPASIAGKSLADILAGGELGGGSGPVDRGMPLGEMHARGWIPPIPGSVIRTAKLPDPPLLREDEEHLWASQVAQAYRTAAEYVYGKRCWAFSQGPGRYRQLLEEGAQMLFQEGVSPLAWCVWSMQNWLGHGPARARSVFAPARWVFDVQRIYKQAGWHHQTNPCVGGQVVWGPLYRALVAKFAAFRLQLASACLRAEVDVRDLVAEYFPGGWETEYEAAAREAAADRESIRQAVRGGVFLWGAPKAKEGR